MTSDEIFTVMSLRNLEGWLCFAPNENEIEIPEEEAVVEGKTESERLRNVLYVFYKQEVEAGRFTGIFDTFRKTKMEAVIDFIKRKLTN